MADLTGSIGELSFTVSITRKETGKTEEYQLVGVIDEEQLKALKNAETKEHE